MSVWMCVHSVCAYSQNDWKVRGIWVKDYVDCVRDPSLPCTTIDVYVVTVIYQDIHRDLVCADDVHISSSSI